MTREELEEKISDILSDVQADAIWSDDDEGDRLIAKDSIMSLIDLYVSTLPQTVWMKTNKIIFNSPSPL
jgi:hypothetical protein